MEKVSLKRSNSKLKTADTRLPAKSLRERGQGGIIPRKGTFPIVPVRDVVVFPHMIVPLMVGREKSINAIESANEKERKIILATQRDALREDPGPEDIYEVGTVAEVLQVLEMPDGSIKVLVEGLKRAKIESLQEGAGHFRASVYIVEEKEEKTAESEALMRTVREQFAQYVELNPKISEKFLDSVEKVEEAGKLADIVVSHLSLKLETKQKLLEMFSPLSRLKKLSRILRTEIEVVEVERRIQERVREQIGKSQKEYYLQEQMKAIQKELGKQEDSEIGALKSKIRKAKMPKEVETIALEEVGRLSKMMSMSPEATVIRNYVDWLIRMPWNVITRDKLDTKGAAKILDKDHYGLEKVKERVLEYLAVRKLVKNPKGPILCFVGPPGVGKTSVAKSIARALGRKFVRASLGGVRDEAEIRGHRRTYIGALPGKIIQSMKKAKSKNPVFLLDEVDKMSMDFRGDPSAALLEVLDPEQNNQFNDHYLDVDFDLSKVMFITTANNGYAIPPTLLDRMEVIEFSGYSEQEKLKIANTFLIPRQMKLHGFRLNEISIDERALVKVIREYTREAGVRSLEREVANILRKIARKKVEGKEQRIFRVRAKMLEEMLPPPQYKTPEAEKKDEIGVATGLAWSEAGGELLYVEVTPMEGKGNLILTGKLGEVMQESAQAALSYLRSQGTKWGLKKEFYKKVDIHIHVPEGAIPKDGPSAGIAIVVALASALSKRAARKRIAMTGEITLRGKVLPVGGIKGKVLAAHRSGIKSVILPKDNEKDLKDLPAYVKKDLTFMLVEKVDEVLKKTLVI